MVSLSWWDEVSGMVRWLWIWLGVGVLVLLWIYCVLVWLRQLGLFLGGGLVDCLVGGDVGIVLRWVGGLVVRS